ncbi:hypothetical protein [Komagataeibacter swingsii]|nr:hypothetical protein [Komagataeibacter swingsii]
MSQIMKLFFYGGIARGMEKITRKKARGSCQIPPHARDQGLPARP